MEVEHYSFKNHCNYPIIMIRSRIATAEKFVACDLKISQVQKKKDKEKELKKRES